MKITLTPIRHDTPLTASRKGDVLVLNGLACDLAKAETCDWILGTPVKEGGIWQVTLILPHGPDAPEETLFPAAIDMVKDGPVPLPPYDGPVTDGETGAGAPPAGA
jgi:hypothetical protein